MVKMLPISIYCRYTFFMDIPVQINPQKYVPSLHLKSQLRLRPSVKFQMHILAPSDKRLPMHGVNQGWANCGPRDHFMRPAGTCKIVLIKHVTLLSEEQKKVKGQ